MLRSFLKVDIVVNCANFWHGPRDDDGASIGAFAGCKSESLLCQNTDRCIFLLYWPNAKTAATVLMNLDESNKLRSRLSAAGIHPHSVCSHIALRADGGMEWMMNVNETKLRPMKW